MEVILLEKVANLGSLGDKVKVKVSRGDETVELELTIGKRS